MSILGLDSALVTPVWDVARIEPHMEMLGEAGVRLLELALPRPQSFDAARAQGFSQRWNTELLPVLLMPPEIDPLERLQEGLDFLEPALRAAVEMGSASLAGLLPAQAREMPRQPPSQRAIDALSRFLERAARAARPHGLRLSIQPAPRHRMPLLGTAAQAAWLVERVGAENLTIALDTAVMNGEEEDLAAAFEAAAPFLALVCATESNRGIPGRGLLDWEAAFKSLAETGYGGPVVAAARPRNGGADLPAPWRERGARLEEMVEEGLPHLREAARRAGLLLG